MSLISPRNFVGPLRSKFQIGTLIIVVVLVLVIRLGTSHSGDASSAAKLPSTGRSGGSRDLSDMLDRAEQPPREQKNGRAKDDILDGLVADGFNQPPSQPESQATKSQSFEDIRKSLGLE